MTSRDWNHPRPELLKKAQVRIFTLFLQAAHREGLLPTEGFEAVRDELVWRVGNQALCVPGRVFSGGQRLRIDSLPHESGEGLDFQRALRLVGELAGVDPQSRTWKALVDELSVGVEVQAAAYAAALERSEPNDWESFECWTPEGHNLHPGAKTREGFTVEDQLAYCPDFAQTLELPWISVDKSLLQASGTVPAVFDLGDRWALPVHPWQRREILPRAYQAEWADGRITDLDRPAVVAHLTTSLRTVIPREQSLPILKLSVGSLMTSTERSMSRHTVLQGPVYTQLLQRVWAGKPIWADRVSLFEETGGLCWADPEAKNGRSRQLSLLFRERPENPQGLLPVPCSSLPQPSGPKLESNLWRELFSRGSGPLANFEEYCRLLIPLHIGLMMEAGVALEAHLQNCVMLWSEVGPQALWIRDWGGLRADSERVRDLFPDLWTQLDPTSVTLTDGASARRKLLACLYSNHLAEVVVGLAEEFDLSVRELWAIVARQSRTSLESYQGSDLAREILDEPWSVKSLLRLRLGAEGEDYRQLPNPLSEVNLLAMSSLDTRRPPQ